MKALILCRFAEHNTWHIDGMLCKYNVCIVSYPLEFLNPEFNFRIRSKGDFELALELRSRNKLESELAQQDRHDQLHLHLRKLVTEALVGPSGKRHVRVVVRLRLAQKSLWLELERFLIEVRVPLIAH
jgi:hypothetical protein